MRKSWAEDPNQRPSFKHIVDELISLERAMASSSKEVDDPALWGVTVKQIWNLWEEVEDDLTAYSNSHQLCNVGGNFCHVCSQVPCSHHERPVSKDSLSQKEQEAFEPLIPNMHLVVSRYIKPRTNLVPRGCSYAALLNQELLKANTFVSHSWSHPFGDFASTLKDALDEDEAVWICSFALNQHSDLTAILGPDVFQSPFARALDACTQVILIVDQEVQALTRSWCVFEMYLTDKRGKKLDIWTHDWSKEQFEVLSQSVNALDVRKCSATNVQDHKSILKVIAGTEDELNRKVKKCVGQAQRKIKAMHRDRDQSPTTSRATSSAASPLAAIS